MNKYLPNGMLGLGLTGADGVVHGRRGGERQRVQHRDHRPTWSSPTSSPDRDDDYYIRIGRFATVGGMVVAIGTALIASGYDNLMNYLQALFSIFNAPLFATFIIAMFWKRVTSAAGLWGLIAGTITALVVYVGYKFTGTFDFGSDLDESFWGAGAAFVVDALVTVIVTLGPSRSRWPSCRASSGAWSTNPRRPSSTSPSGGTRPTCWASRRLGLAAILTIIFF